MIYIFIFSDRGCIIGLAKVNTSRSLVRCLYYKTTLFMIVRHNTWTFNDYRQMLKTLSFCQLELVFKLKNIIEPYNRYRA